jgi:hypothetical protein
VPWRILFYLFFFFWCPCFFFLACLEYIVAYLRVWIPCSSSN